MFCDIQKNYKYQLEIKLLNMKFTDLQWNLVKIKSKSIAVNSVDKQWITCKHFVYYQNIINYIPECEHEN